MSVNGDRQNQLIHEIGSMILLDPKFAAHDWDSLSLVLEYREGGKGIHGYKYAGERWIASAPSDFDIHYRLADLRSAMAEHTDEPWNWGLLTIVAPTMDIAIDFSYDEKNPWGLETKSLDMRGYARSLRSPNHPSESRVDIEFGREWGTLEGR